MRIRVIGLLAAVALAVGLFAGVAAAAPSASMSLMGPTFTKIATGGFGDSQNSYAWSMAEFKGDLYVGTGRLSDTFSPMWENIWKALTPGQRPQQIPDVPYPPFLQDFLQVGQTGYYVTDPGKYAQWNSVSAAEVYRYHGGTWSRVYQAKQVPSLLQPAQAYTAAEATGFRSMIVYTDKTGTQALYASSGGFSFAYNPAKIFRTLDGTSWTGLVTPPGMGRETRALTVHNGKLYVGASGTLAGQTITSVWSSDNPSDPASWTKVIDFATLDPSNSGVESLASFNGHLYVGTENRNGFQIWRSKQADPAGNADWVRVVTDGAGDRYNAWAATMKVFNGYLYVGSIGLPYLSNYNTFKGFDIIRVSTGDKWQLVVGNVKPVAPPPGYSLRWPLSGLGSGFGNPMNFYCWSLEVYNGYLYGGSFDASVILRYLPMYTGPLPAGIPKIPNSLVALSQVVAGADLWRTKTGALWLPVTVTGFGDPENYGFRTMRALSTGLYIGTANPFEGCQVWKAGS